jgi:hypothetical protein
MQQETATIQQETSTIQQDTGMTKQQPSKMQQLKDPPTNNDNWLCIQETLISEHLL